MSTFETRRAQMIIAEVAQLSGSPSFVDAHATTEDRDAAALLKQYAPSPADLLLVVCADGSVLESPTEGELATCLGMARIAGRQGLRAHGVGRSPSPAVAQHQ